jgi:hypothetical protein
MVRGESYATLTKTKGFRCLLLLAESQGRPKPGDIYEFPLADLRSLLDCNDDATLATELQSLSKITVNWAKVIEGKCGYSVPVSSCIWDAAGSGMLRFAFDPQFVERWMDNSLGFQPLDWEILVSFSSRYAAKIYEYTCMSHQDDKPVHTPKLSSEELRHLLAIPVTAYRGKNSSILYREIEKATKVVNRAQIGYTVSYCRSRRGKAARHWWEVENAPEKQGRFRFAPTAKVIRSGDTLRCRIEATLNALTDAEKIKAMEALAGCGLWPLPNDMSIMKSCAAALVGAGITIPDTIIDRP